MKFASRLTLSRFAQAIKVGVAGIVALSLAQLLRLPQAYWAAISAFVVMAPDVSKTVRASRDRLFGTAIGAILGAVFMLLWGNHLLCFGLTATAAVLLCAALGLDQSYRLACVTVAIIMLVKSADSPWMIALHRFIEVTLGILVALAISALPPQPPPTLLQPLPRDSTPSD